MKTGAVVVAAGMSSRMNDFKPMMKIGSITTIERVITTLIQAGAELVVVITGFQADMLEKHLSKQNVICFYNKNYKTTEMFDSAKIGLEYLKDKCDQILFTPADIPLFSVNTVKKLIKSNELLAKPTCNGHGGHPLLINSKLIPSILSYDGNDGLKNALSKISADLKRIEVDDKGILLDADTQEDFRELLQHRNNKMLRPKIKLLLAKEDEFLDQKTVMLLRLIDETNSVKSASERLNISYREAWNILNHMEEQLGFPSIVDRQECVYDDCYKLTEEGKDFLEKYRYFTQEAEEAIEKIYDKIFANY
ncbi:NTP transferase domain-containing protein [uncultured Clostridium sp.]|uniref:NTP transferase domain-containing protein n=1 Tax=uncultured Clostridium sp. TaxID=59620 RepID=UPI0025DB7D47|nr:NTP transferase domain-containing protein [uncultured Clostridium sp.]